MKNLEQVAAVAVCERKSEGKKGGRERGRERERGGKITNAYVHNTFQKLIKRQVHELCTSIDVGVEIQLSYINVLNTQCKLT